MYSQKMERKPSFKERAFEKLGLSGSRPKSQSFDGSSLPNICGTIEPGVAPRFLSTGGTPPPNGQWKQQYTITTRPCMDVEEILSNLGMARAVADIPAEKKKIIMTKPQPKGSKEYSVSASDTLESVAAQFDTTPSELVTLNKLTMRMLFPGETIFVPDPEYIPPEDPPPDPPADPPVLPTVVPTLRDTPSPLSLDPVTPDFAFTNKHISQNDSGNSSGSTSIFEFSRPKLDIPLVAMSAKPLKVVPGHAERQTSTTSPEQQADSTETPGRTLSMDETKRLDKECFERFIKINVKHITDGQGVITGVLLVTPNAVMFDPNVSDPLVIEHGPEKYGMIATMDTIISAAMYHDIAAMKLRGQREDEREPSPRPEVYRANKSSADSESDRKKSGSNSSDAKISPIPQTSTGSDSSDKFFEESGEFETVSTEASDVVASCSTKTDASSNDIDNSQSKTVPQTAELNLPKRDQSQTVSHPDLAAVQPEKESGVTLDSERERSTVDDDSFCFPKKHKSVDLIPVSFKEIPQRSSSINSKGVDSSQHDLSDSILSNITSDIVNNSSKTNLASHSSYGNKSVNFDENVHTIPETSLNSKTSALGVDSGNDTGVFDGDDSVFRPISPSLKPDMQIGNINYFQFNGKENKPTQSLDSMDVDDSRTSPINLKQYNTSNTGLSPISGGENENLTDSGTNIKSSSPLSKSPTGTGGVFGSLPNSPHISAFVNYATGLFRSTAEDRTNIKDIVDACSTKVRNLSGGSSSGGTPPNSASSSGLPSLSSAKGFIEVENIIKLADMPELFQSLDKLIPRPALRSDDPPLYLCLRVGQPINKQISTGGPIESYGKKKKKPEYWFSIPRDKVDQLYAFFIQWSPDKYGDKEDIDAAERGFVVIGDDLQNLDRDDSLDIFDEYFGPESSQRIHRDWEIVTRSEALRRMNSMEADSVIIPELLGQSSVLNDERIRELTKSLPARAVGYPWTLIYSTDLHGFSLKTLYRGMHRLEGPILLVIEDTEQHVFGAVTSCPLKISDHFYGTGESFLYTFAPEFKVFPWSGENHFCIKGNNESLAIGAGQGIFGLWFDESLFHGRSHCCETYKNDVLSASEDFVVKTFEAWAFVDVY